MSRYILIDQNSGYIWHDVDTTGPIAASVLTDEECGGLHGLEYTETHDHDPSATYHVYAAPPGFRQIDDGQSAEQIAAVTDECDYVTSVRHYSPAE